MQVPTSKGRGRGGTERGGERREKLGDIEGRHGGREGRGLLLSVGGERGDQRGGEGQREGLAPPSPNCKFK